MKSKKLLTAVFTVLAFLDLSVFLSAEEANVSLKIDVVAWGDTIKGLRITTDGKSTPVIAEAFQYSKAVSYSGSKILQLSQGDAPQKPAVAPPADASVKLSELDKRRLKDPSIVALALLPTDSKRVTLLVAPGPNGTYQTFVIDDDPTKFPLGKLRIHNHCSIPISMRCNGSAPTELKLKQTMVAVPVEGCVNYELAYKQDEQWIVQEKNIVRVNPKEQTQLIILKSDASYFTSSDGSRGGFLQAVILRRGEKEFVESTPGATPPPQ